MQKLIYEGKTKNVFENADGTYTLKLKDDATGKDGMFDPGENAVGLSIEGLGRESLKITKYFFDKVIAAGIPTHFLGCDIEAATMDVKPATMFGKGLEFICRVSAGGSFVKRYGAYATQGQYLDYLVEVTIKDDERCDPIITKGALVQLGLMTKDEFKICKKFTKEITKIIFNDLNLKGLALQDIKFEFGKAADGTTMLIDEISAGSMRVYRAGQIVPPMELGKLILGGNS